MFSTILTKVNKCHLSFAEQIGLSHKPDERLLKFVSAIHSGNVDIIKKDSGECEVFTSKSHFIYQSLSGKYFKRIDCQKNSSPVFYKIS